MPTFIGSLSQNDDQEAISPLLDSQDAVLATAAIDGTAAAAALPGGSGAGVIVTDPTPGLIKRATWKPSGGKKLSTGLAIVLENVASGFKRPNVLDVKLGARLWDDASPVAKRRKLDEVAERTTSGSLGFRVAGMKVWVGENATREANAAHEENVEVKNGYKSYDKLYGQSFNKETVVDAVTTYLGGVDRDAGNGKVAFRQPKAEMIARRLIRELESIQYVLEHEESRMYSASVLMVYEGDEEALEAGMKIEEAQAGKDAVDDGDEVDEVEEEDEEEGEEEDMVPQKVHEVRLIDFAHANWTPGQGPDENALRGIRSLLGILRGLVE